MLPRRYGKNVIEPRHRTIRSLSPRRNTLSWTHLMQPTLGVPLEFLMTNTACTRCPRSIWRQVTRSYCQLIKSLCKARHPLELWHPVDQALLQAHDERAANHKLTLILWWNFFSSDSVKPRDLVQDFSKHERDESGTWTSQRQILSICYEAGSIYVIGWADKTVWAAIEHAHAFPQNRPI